MSVIVVHFDGACGPVNPGGTASFGYTITVDNKEFESNSGIIGKGPKYSNNYAEFYALYSAFKAMANLIKPEDLVIVNGDSQIVINAMKKRKGSEVCLYYPAFVLTLQELRSIRNKGAGVVFNWIPRKQNKRADELSKLKK